MTNGQILLLVAFGFMILPPLLYVAGRMLSAGVLRSIEEAGQCRKKS